MAILHKHHPYSAVFKEHFPLQNILFSIGSSFLYYVNHFKLYSSFCASHSKAQKVLHPSKYPHNILEKHILSSEKNISKLERSKETVDRVSLELISI